MDDADLPRLVDLIRRRNENEATIAPIIGRPALPGHIGEFIASRIFDIELDGNATRPGSDGLFRSAGLANKSVNVKFYPKRDGSLDINVRNLPDYYLVLAGPKDQALSSRGAIRPWCIKEVFLFEAAPLVARLKKRPVKVGTATSVTDGEWSRARIFPVSRRSPLGLTDAQQVALGLFDLCDG